MKFYVIAGEASGDLHAANLIKALRELNDKISVRAWGGDLMTEAGAEVVKHYRDLAFMGFIEVVKNLPTILKNLSWCKSDILSYQPDVLILVDYPGFNLRIAKWAKKRGIRVVYYISPQIWAWKENRVKAIRRDVDQMLVILPFEKNFYKKWNVEVEYVGHPLVEVVDYAKQHLQPLSSNGSPMVALLPGSRKQEIQMKLPVMLQVAAAFPQYQFVVAKAPGLEDDFYASLLAPFPNVSAVRNQTYPLLLEAKAAMVTSGTATLETALFGVPELVCYKGSKISYAIAKRLIKVPFISLVNLIAEKEIVKELIQDQMNVENCKQELDRLLNNPTYRQQMLTAYAELRDMLQKGGQASKQAAKSILDALPA